MSDPKTVPELGRFLGMVNQFTPQIAKKTKPLRDLLSRKMVWLWGHVQQQAFSSLKSLLLSSEVILAKYSHEKPTTVPANASSYGLGAVISQLQEDGWIRPVAYASRSLTDIEQRYAQVEKETLAVTWTCEKFADYLVGLKFHIETDHKPLISLLSVKHLDELPPRIQRAFSCYSNKP